MVTLSTNTSFRATCMNTNKITSFTLFVLLGFGLMTTSLSAETASTNQQDSGIPADRIEPNDSYKSATAVGQIDVAHTSDELSFHSISDIDYLSLSLKEGVSYRFFTQVPAESQSFPIFSLSRKDANKPGGYNAGYSRIWKSRDSQLFFTPDKDGEYVLIISNKTRKPGYYEIGVSAGINDSTNQIPEPNGTLNKAYKVKIDPSSGDRQIYKSTFHTPNDVDYIMIDPNGFSAQYAFEIIGENGVPVEISSATGFTGDSLNKGKYGLSIKKLSDTNSAVIVDSFSSYSYKKLIFGVRPGRKVTMNNFFSGGSFKELTYRVEIITGDANEKFTKNSERLASLMSKDFSLHSPDDVDVVWFPIILGTTSYNIQTSQLGKNADTTISNRYAICNPNEDSTLSQQTNSSPQADTKVTPKVDTVRVSTRCFFKYTAKQSLSTIDDGGTEPRASMLKLSSEEIKRNSPASATHIGVQVSQSPKVGGKYYNSETNYRISSVGTVKVRVSPSNQGSE